MKDSLKQLKNNLNTHHTVKKLFPHTIVRFKYPRCWVKHWLFLIYSNGINSFNTNSLDARKRADCWLTSCIGSHRSTTYSPANLYFTQLFCTTLVLYWECIFSVHINDLLSFTSDIIHRYFYDTFFHSSVWYLNQHEKYYSTFTDLCSFKQYSKPRQVCTDNGFLHNEYDFNMNKLIFQE